MARLPRKVKALHGAVYRTSQSVIQIALSVPIVNCLSQTMCVASWLVQSHFVITHCTASVNEVKRCVSFPLITMRIMFESFCYNLREHGFYKVLTLSEAFHDVNPAIRFRRDIKGAVTRYIKVGEFVVLADNTAVRKREIISHSQSTEHRLNFHAFSMARFRRKVKG
jgi:hypothetical protein